MSLRFFPLIFIFIVLGLSSCGVKSPPIAPEGTALPSLLDPYTQSPSHDKSNDEENENE